MMQVTLQGAAIIRAEDLATFLQMAGVPATVQLCEVIEDNDMAPIPEAQPVVKDKPARRGPRKAAESTSRPAEPVVEKPAANPVVAESAAVTPDAGQQTAVEEPHKPAPAAQDSSDLQERFMAFVTADYDAALAMLQGFKVDRFSELPESELENFGHKMAEAGF